MNDFQKTVGLSPAIGVAGQAVVPAQAVYTPFQYISDGTVEAGQFVFTDASPQKGKNIAYLKKSGGKLLGFAVRNQVATVPNPFVSATNVYPEGQPVGIAIRGQFYFQVPSDATPTDGQSVLCNPDDGKVTFGAAGTANDTGWVLRFPQGVDTVAEGAIVIIENWGLNNKG